MYDELMSAILFCTTPKGDLPHYCYHFRNPEPLDTKMENLSCYILGAMPQIDIQKRKEAMKTSIFKKDLGGTALFTKRLIMA